MFAKEAIDFPERVMVERRGLELSSGTMSQGLGGEGEQGTRGLSPHLIGALIPSLVSFAVTLWTHLWDRRLCTSHLPGSAETARFCRPLPKLRSQGA